MLRNTSSLLFEDSVCLLLKVFDKNSFLMKNQRVDIKDFYSGRGEVYFEYLNQIDTFYKHLRKRKKAEKTFFESVYEAEISHKTLIGSRWENVEAKTLEMRKNLEEHFEIREGLMDSFASLDMGFEDSL